MEYFFQYQFMQNDDVNLSQGGMNFRQVAPLVCEDMPYVAAFLVKAKGMLSPRLPDVKSFLPAPSQNIRKEAG
jgi:hypothetical protein